MSCLEQERLVVHIDSQVKAILANNGDANDILISLSDHAIEINSLMDSLSMEEMDIYCQQYEGFCLFMAFLDELSSAVKNEEMILPTYH